MQLPAFHGSGYRTPEQLTEWHRQNVEAAIEPELPIVDAHHHLWPEAHRRFEAGDLVAYFDGMNVVGTVFVECSAAYDVPFNYRPGVDGVTEDYRAPAAEIRYVVGSVRGDAVAAKHGVCEGIVGTANLMMGEAAAVDVLESFIAAGEGRFRGIRQASAWDAAAGVHSWRMPPPGLLLDDRFQSGFKALGRLGLSFDAWLFYPQLGDLVRLARRFPDVQIIMNHFGGVIGIGPYEKWAGEGFRYWQRQVRELAGCPNVAMKMGGLGMPLTGIGLYVPEVPVSSAAMAEVWKPYVTTCVEAFGVERCMLESNFPVDRQTATYVKLWNAYKIATKSYSKSERQALFSGTASRVYGLRVSAG